MQQVCLASLYCKDRAFHPRLHPQEGSGTHTSRLLCTLCKCESVQHRLVGRVGAAQHQVLGALGACVRPPARPLHSGPVRPVRAPTGRPAYQCAAFILFPALRRPPRGAAVAGLPRWSIHAARLAGWSLHSFEPRLAAPRGAAATSSRPVPPPARQRTGSGAASAALPLAAGSRARCCHAAAPQVGRVRSPPKPSPSCWGRRTARIALRAGWMAIALSRPALQACCRAAGHPGTTARYGRGTARGQLSVAPRRPAPACPGLPAPTSGPSLIPPRLVQLRLPVPVMRAAARPWGMRWNGRRRGEQDRKQGSEPDSKMARAKISINVTSCMRIYTNLKQNRNVKILYAARARGTIASSFQKQKCYNIFPSTRVLPNMNFCSFFRATSTFLLQVPKVLHEHRQRAGHIGYAQCSASQCVAACVPPVPPSRWCEWSPRAAAPYRPESTRPGRGARAPPPRQAGR